MWCPKAKVVSELRQNGGKQQMFEALLLTTSLLAPPARPEAIVRELPPGAVEVASVFYAGSWEDGDRHGDLRVIVLNRGLEHVYQEVWIQWIELHPIEHLETIVASVSIEEANRSHWNISVDVEYENRRPVYRLNSSHSGFRQKVVFDVEPLAPGKYLFRDPRPGVTPGAILADPPVVPQWKSRDSAPTSHPIFEEEDVIRYIRKWRIKDGTAGFHISDYFCSFLIWNPYAFFDVMSRETVVFNEWLQSVTALSFTDYGGCVDTACLRDGVLFRLRGLANETRHADLIAALTAVVEATLEE